MRSVRRSLRYARDSGPHGASVDLFFDQIGGGLALGAALLGGGLFAYNHHKKGEEEVSLSRPTPNSASADSRYHRKRQQLGVCRTGSRMLRPALSSSTSMVPRALSPGFSCRATTSLPTPSLVVKRMDELSTLPALSMKAAFVSTTFRVIIGITLINRCRGRKDCCSLVQRRGHRLRPQRDFRAYHTLGVARTAV